MLRENIIDVEAYRFRLEYIERKQDWEDDPVNPGKRRRSQAQQRDRDTGMPVWSVYASAPGREGGQIEVVVPAAEEPNIEEGERITFQRLRMRPWVSKGGASGADWRADEVRTLSSGEASRDGRFARRGAAAAVGEAAE